MEKSKKEILIEEFTNLLIKQDFEDKKNKKVSYVKKIRVYKDIIKFIKEYL